MNRIIMKKTGSLQALLITLAFVTPITSTPITTTATNYEATHLITSTIAPAVNPCINPRPALDALPASKTGTTVAFDLNGVLFTTDRWQAFKDVGLKLISYYALQHGIGTASIEHRLPQKLYALLHKIQPEGNDCGACDHWGNLMPGLMCDWQRGKKSMSEIKTLINSYIERHPNWYGKSKASEQQLILNLINKMFSPARLIASMTLIPEGVALAKQCKKEGHTLVVLSNWDAESFPLLQKKFPELFELFDAVIISGEAHVMKPESAMYEGLVTRKNTHNEQVIFIDDQQENIMAAREQGITALHWPLNAEAKRVLSGK